MKTALPYRLRKLIRLSGTERRELFSAQRALIRAQLLVWIQPAGKLLTTHVETPITGSDAEAGMTARRLALAVNRAADHGVFRPACLVRAVALQRLLESRRIFGSRIRIGVRQQGGRFAAHAWVEYGDQLLGDRERHVQTFTSLTDVRLARPR